MNSSTSRVNERRQTQDEIKRQIALLQTQLDSEPDPVLPLPAQSPKRKTPSTVTLAPPTPSPSAFLGCYKVRKKDTDSHFCM